MHAIFAAALLAISLLAPANLGVWAQSMSTMGPLSTKGTAIVDRGGREVRLQGLNWFGLETPNMVPHGLWARDYRQMLAEIAALGFNTLRLPFSNEIIHAGIQAIRPADITASPELKGLTPLEILDAVIAEAGRLGLAVILDDHGLVPTRDGRSDGLWFNRDRDEEAWIADWRLLAERYRANPAVIGADLLNEPGGGWGTGRPDDWARAAKRAGDAVLEVAPDWLIIVEGIRAYGRQPSWWGGNLVAVADHPIGLARPAQLVYSAHDYPPSLYEQPWFGAARYPANLPGFWEEQWGFIDTRGIAPVVVGEFGSRLETERDRQWADQMARFLSDRRIDWIWWSWNANGEPRGLLSEDWRTPEPRRLAYLKALIEGTKPRP